MSGPVSLRYLLPGLLAVGLVAGCATQDASPPGQQVQVQPASQPVRTCPATAPAHGAKPAGPATTMVPAGPSSALVCRYSGMDGPKPLNQLVKQSTPLTGPSLNTLVTELNSAKETLHGVTSCPMDDAASDLVIFSYPAGAPDYVSVGLTGCEQADNGAHTVAFLNQKIFDQLAGLVGTDQLRSASTG